MFVVAAKNSNVLSLRLLMILMLIESVSRVSFSTNHESWQKQPFYISLFINVGLIYEELSPLNDCTKRSKISKIIHIAGTSLHFVSVQLQSLMYFIGVFYDSFGLQLMIVFVIGYSNKLSFKKNVYILQIFHLITFKLISYIRLH